MLISCNSCRIPSTEHAWDERSSSLREWQPNVRTLPPPHFADVSHVRVPLTIFASILAKQLARTIRPPSKKHLGTRLRETPAMPTAEHLWQDLLSVRNGLPATIAKTEMDPGIERTESGQVKPYKSTAAGDRFKIKLQDPSHIKAFCRLEERVPGRGLGASMLMKDNRVAMAAAPFVVRCSVPKGSASALRFPMLSLKLNV